MTEGQQAHADGFAANLAVHGKTFVRTSDSAPIKAVAARLKVENPAMVNSQDRPVNVLVADASLVGGGLTAADVMPSARLKKGDELTKGAKKFRVVRADLSEANTLWNIELSPTF